MKAIYLILVVLLFTGLTLGCLGGKKTVNESNETNGTVDNTTLEDTTQPSEQTQEEHKTTTTEHKTVTIDKSSINITDITEDMTTSSIDEPNLTDDDLDLGELI